MKRFGLRWRARYYGAGLATVAFVALTMLVVLPAFASTPSDQVPPRSGAGVMPVDIGVGGNQSCSSQGLFQNMTGVQETTDPSPPQSGQAFYPSGQGWDFKLTSGALPGFNANKGQSLAVDSQGNAAIVGIAIKGGTDNLAYDYRPSAPGWVSADTLLHAPASKFTAGTNPETGITQYYGVSQLVICWKPATVATIAGNASVAGNPPSPALNVTLTDTGPTTPGTQTVSTDASGNYSFQAVSGDSHTVCISSPGSSYAQTVPATDGTGGACAGGTNGYSIANLPAGGSSGNNFAFQPTASVTVNAFFDNNGNQVNDSGDSAASTGVQLFDSANSPVGSSQTTTGGSTTFGNLASNQTYKVCAVTPSGGSYKETLPISSTTNAASCPTGYASLGYSFTLTSSGKTVSFGFQPLKSITVNAFFDNNDNGSNDFGDTGAATSAALINSSGTVLATQTTTGGTTTFSNVPVSSTYKVCVATPSPGSYSQTAPTSGASCPSGYAAVGYSYPNFSADQTANFGFVPLKSITVNAFIDNNGNGSKDGSDTAAVIGAALINSSGTVLATQTTTGGTTTFSNVPVGQTYKVCVTTPSPGSYDQTVPTSGASCPSGYAAVGYSYPSFSADQTASFGFQPVGSLSGTVYQDDNGPAGAGPDGAFESGTDTPLGLWTVTLYDGSKNVVGTTMSGPNGQYSFSVPFDPTQMYTACVTPASPTDVYAQSEPLPTSGNNCTSPQLPKGQTFQPTSSGASETANFGVVPAVREPCPPPAPFGTGAAVQTIPNDPNNPNGHGSLTIKLAGCKANQTFAFGTGNLPDGSYWASVFAGDQVVTAQNPETPMIEKWVFPDPIKADGTPAFTHVDYTDVFPYVPSAAQQLPQCQVDPRVADDMTLGTVGGIDFTQYANRTHVLPNPDVNPDGVTPATSCAISTRIYVDGSGQHWLEVYAYSDIDSWGKSSG